MSDLPDTFDLSMDVLEKTMDDFVRKHESATSTFMRLLAERAIKRIITADGEVITVSPIYHSGRIIPNHCNVSILDTPDQHEEEWLSMYRDPGRPSHVRREFVVVPLDVVATILARRGGPS